jgi:hypothetical protein
MTKFLVIPVNMTDICFEQAGLFDKILKNKIHRDALLLSLAHCKRLNSFLPTNEPGNGNGVKIQLA